MKSRVVVSAISSFVLLGATFAQAPAEGWLNINRANLCVTEGAIANAAGSRLSINVPKMRAYVNTWTSQSIEMSFTYLGTTSDEKALASGEMRRQFGFKLQAQDPCNLVYAIWRIDPESKLVVSVKRNPAAHTSAECGNGGYENIKPRKSADVPRLKSGDSHTFRAELKKAGAAKDDLKNEDLRVFVDNHEVWEGDIGSDAAQLNGPVGIRSDNARLEFDLKAGKYEGIHPNYIRACQSGNSD